MERAGQCRRHEADVGCLHGRSRGGLGHSGFVVIGFGCAGDGFGPELTGQVVGQVLRGDDDGRGQDDLRHGFAGQDLLHGGDDGLAHADGVHAEGGRELTGLEQVQGGLVAINADGEEVLVDGLAELFAGEGGADRHLVGVAVEDINVGVLLPGDGGDFGTLGAQPFTGLFADDGDVGAVLGQAGLEAAGAAVGEDGVNAEQDEDLALGLVGGGVVLLGDQVAGGLGELLGAAPLVVADVGDDLALGEGGDEVVSQDRDALLVGGLDRGDGGVGADRVDGDGLDALFEQLLDGGDEGLEVAFGGRGLDVELPAEFLGFSGGAIYHRDVERAGQCRRHEADVGLLCRCGRGGLGGLGRSGRLGRRNHGCAGGRAADDHDRNDDQAGDGEHSLGNHENLLFLDQVLRQGSIPSCQGLICGKDRSPMHRGNRHPVFARRRSHGI